MARFGRHTLLLVLAGLLFAGGAGAADARDDGVSEEYQIKAAFLYNFGKYVEWPPERFAAAGSPLVIGAYCPEAFGDLLGRIVQGRRIDGRDIIVKTLKAASEARAVHLVFVCAQNDALWRPLADALVDSAVLTVADAVTAKAPTPPGSMIAFVLEGDKVRFHIDVSEAGRAGLRISDQLQKLALSVRRAP